ncbi:MAG: acyltransferase domain-containing protein, partial [Terricaulis sp.]
VVDPLLGRSLRGILADDALLKRTEYTQPALMAVQLAFAETLARWGIVPAAVVGHSLGELTACAVAGVWTHEQALRLAVARGRLMEELARPGSMAAIAADAFNHHQPGVAGAAGRSRLRPLLSRARERTGSGRSRNDRMPRERQRHVELHGAFGGSARLRLR